MNISSKVPLVIELEPSEIGEAIEAVGQRLGVDDDEPHEQDQG